MADIFDVLAAQASQPANPFERMRQAQERNNRIAEERKAQMAAQFNVDIPEYTPIQTKSIGDQVQDLGVSALASTVGLVNAGVGTVDLGIYGAQKVASLLTGEPVERTGIFGNWLENSTPVRLREAAQAINAMHSDAYLKQQQEFKRLADFSEDKTAGENFKVFSDLIGNLVDNPALAVNAAVESLPTMFAGGLLGKGAATLAPRLLGTTTAAGVVQPTMTASALGEGLIMGGAQQESIRQQTPEGYTTPGQSSIALSTGVAGGTIARLSGGLGRRLGLEDADQLVAGVANTGSKLPGVVKYPATMLKEGFVEEAPQTFYESTAENVALDRDLLDNVAHDIALATGAGIVTAGGVQAPHMFKGASDSVKDKADSGKGYAALSDPANPKYNPAKAYQTRTNDLTSSNEQVRQKAEEDVTALINTAEERYNKYQKAYDTHVELQQTLQDLREQVQAAQESLAAGGLSPQEEQDAQELIQMYEELSQKPQYSAELGNQIRSALDAATQQYNDLIAAKQAHEEALKGATENSAPVTKKDVQTNVSTLTEATDVPIFEPLNEGDVVVSVDLERGSRVIRQANGKEAVEISFKRGPATEDTNAQAAAEHVKSYPMLYSPEDIIKIVDTQSPYFDEEERSVLRLLAEFRVEQNKSKDLQDVTQDVTIGNKRQRYWGLNDYITHIPKAVASGDTKSVDHLLNQLGRWAEFYQKKADAVQQAFKEARSTNNRAGFAVVPTEEKEWVIVPGQLKPGKLKELGAVNVHLGTGDLVAAIAKDAATVNKGYIALSDWAESRQNKMATGTKVPSALTPPAASTSPARDQQVQTPAPASRPAPTPTPAATNPVPAPAAQTQQDPAIPESQRAMGNRTVVNVIKARKDDYQAVFSDGSTIAGMTEAEINSPYNKDIKDFYEKKKAPAPKKKKEVRSVVSKGENLYEFSFDDGTVSTMTSAEVSGDKELRDAVIASKREKKAEPETSKESTKQTKPAEQSSNAEDFNNAMDQIREESYAPDTQEASTSDKVEKQAPSEKTSKDRRESTTQEKVKPQSSAKAETNQDSQENPSFTPFGDTSVSDAFAKAIREIGETYSEKDAKKAEKATGFIGVGVAGSSTDKYAKLAKQLGMKLSDFTSEDVVFVSVNGSRTDRVPLYFRNAEGTRNVLSDGFKPLAQAVEAGATIIADAPKDRYRSFNVGERELAFYLMNKNYVETDIPGVWIPKVEAVQNTPAEEVKEAVDTPTEPINEGLDGSVEDTAPITLTTEEMIETRDKEYAGILTAILPNTPGGNVDRNKETLKKFKTLLKAQKKEMSDDSILQETVEQKNFVKAFLVQKSAEGRNPLVHVKDFLAALANEENPVSIESYLGRPLNENEQEYWAFLSTIHNKLKEHLVAGFTEGNKGTDLGYRHIRPFSYFNTAVLDAQGNLDKSKLQVVVTKEGNKVVLPKEEYATASFDDNLITAMALAALNYILLNDPRVGMTNADIARMLGINENELIDGNIFREKGVPKDNVFKNLGKTAYKALGFKVTENAPENFEDSLVKSIGFNIGRALISMGLLKENGITVEEAEILPPTGSEVFDKAVEEFLEDPNRNQPTRQIKLIQINQNHVFTKRVLRAMNKSSGSFLGNVFKSPISKVGPSLTPVKKVKTAVKGSITHISKLQERMLEVAQQQPHVVRDDVVSVVRYLKNNYPEVLYDIYNSNPEEEAVQDLPYYKRGGELDSRRKNFQDLEENLIWIEENITEENNKFYYSMWAGKNARSYMDAQVMNYQSSKASRSMIAMEGFKASIQIPKGDIQEWLKVPEHRPFVQFLKAAAMQLEDINKVLGIAKSAEKTPYDVFLPKFFEYLQQEDVKSTLRALTKIRNNEEVTKEEVQSIGDLVAAGNTNGMSLMALVELSKYQEALDNGQDSFETLIPYDSDGINNGAAIGFLLLGMMENTSENLKQILESVGMLFTDTNMLQKILEEMKDYYQILEGEINAGVDEIAKQGDSTALGKDLIKLLKLIPRDKLTSRSMAKAWAIPFNYGAGFTTLKKALTRYYAEQIMDKIHDIDRSIKFDAATQNVEEALKPDWYIEQSTRETYLDSFKEMFGSPLEDLKDFEFTKSEYTILERIVSDTVGYSAEKGTRELAKNFIEVRDTNTAILGASTKLYSELYKAVHAIEKELASKDLQGSAKATHELTVHQIKGLLKKLSPYSAMINIATSIGDEEIDQNAGATLYKMTYGLKADGRKLEDKFGEHLSTATTNIATPESTGLLGGSIQIQGHDANTTIQIIGNKKLPAQNMHDSNAGGVTYSEEMVRNQNRIFIESVVNYQAGQESVKALVSVLTGLRDLAPRIYAAAKDLNLLEGEKPKVDMKKLLVKVVKRTRGEDTPFEETFNHLDTLAGHEGFNVKKDRGLLELKANNLTNLLKADVNKLNAVLRLKTIHQYGGEFGEYKLTEEFKDYIEDLIKTVEKDNEDLKTQFSSTVRELQSYTLENIEELSQNIKDETPFFGEILEDKDVSKDTLKLVLKNSSEKGMSKTQAIKEIVSRLGENSRQGKMLKYLSDFIPSTVRVFPENHNLELDTEEADTFKKAKGLYVSRVKAILVKTNSKAMDEGALVSTMLHELTHAATVQVLENMANASDRAQTSTRQQAAYNRLKALYETTKEKIGSEHRAKFYNLAEFVAYGVNDQNFREALAALTVPRNGRSVKELLAAIKTRAKNFLKDMLGLITGKPIKDAELNELDGNINALDALEFDLVDLFQEKPEVVKSLHTFSYGSSKIVGTAEVVRDDEVLSAMSVEDLKKVLSKSGTWLGSNLLNKLPHLWKESVFVNEKNGNRTNAVYVRSLPSETNVGEGFILTITTRGGKIVQVGKNPEVLKDEKGNEIDREFLRKKATKTMAESSSYYPMLMDPTGSLNQEEFYRAMDRGNISREFSDHLESLVLKTVRSLAVKDTDINQKLDTVVDVQTTPAIAAGFSLSEKEGYAVKAVELVLEHVFKTNQHAATLAAMRKAYDAARAQLKPEDFYKGDWSTATRADKAIAESQYNYLFGLERSPSGTHQYLERFIALTLGSEDFNKMVEISVPKPVSSKLSWSDRIVGLYKRLLDWVTNKSVNIGRNTPINRQMDLLATKLIDMEVQKRRSQTSKLDTAFNKVENVGDVLNEKMRNAVKSLGDWSSGVNPKYRTIRLVGSVIGLLNSQELKQMPEQIQKLRDSFKPNEAPGDLMQLVNEFMAPTALRDAAEPLVRRATINARMRDEARTGAMRALRNAFTNQGKDLTLETKKSVTYVLLRTDLQALLGSYEMSDVLGFISNPKARKAEISRLETEVAGFENGNAKINRTKVLGWYLVSGVGNELLGKNAEVIARGVGTHYSTETATEEEINSIDLLASLYALDYSKASDLRAVSSLLKSEQNGLEGLLYMHQALNQQARKDFLDNPLNYRKGYVPNKVHPNKEVRTVPGDEDLSLFKKVGWQELPEGVLEQSSLDHTGARKLIIHSDMGYQRFVSGAVDLGNTEKSGFEVYSQTSRDIIDVNKGVLIKHKKNASIPHTSFDPSKEAGGLIAAYDTEGFTLGYSYEMANATRDTYLERNNDFVELMGIYSGMNVYNPQTKELNRTVARFVYDAYKSGYKNNPKGFITLDPKSSDPSIVELWRMLPYSFKEEAWKQFGMGKNIVVPVHIMPLLFGFRKKTLVNVFRSENPNAIEHMLRGLFKAVWGDIAPAKVAKYEHMVMEGVKLLKDIIVLRTGTVLLNNIFANTLMLLIMSKGNPANVFKDIGTGLVHSKRFMQDSAALAQLKAQIQMGGDVVALNKEIALVEDRINKNPLKNFIDEGMLSSIVEDIQIHKNSYSYQSDLEKKVSRYTDNIPEMLKTSAKVLTISSDTKLHKFMAEATQLSDFVAKYALYKAELRAGSNHADALQKASNTFINYDIPTSPWMQYANDMGLVMFTKFLLRIQSVLFGVLRNHMGKAIVYDWVAGQLTHMPGVLDPSIIHRIGDNPFEMSVLGLPEASLEILPIKLVSSIL